jgi:hypothetical protein
MARNQCVGNADVNINAGSRKMVDTLTPNLRITPERPYARPVGSVSETEQTMTNFKTLIAIAALSTAVATPVFAQGAVHHTYKHRNAFNQMNEPAYAAPNTLSTNDYWGAAERDRSRIGGEDPDFNPSGN